MYKILVLFLKKSEMCLSFTTNDKCKTIGDKLDAFGGKSRHTASSENYFSDSTYRNFIRTFSNERKKSKYKLLLIKGQKNHDYAQL